MTDRVPIQRNLTATIASDQGLTRVDDCWNRIGVRGDGSCPELRRHVHCRSCPTYFAAAAALLDRAPPPGHLSGWPSRLAHREPVEVETVLSIFIFRLGAHWLALPAAVLDEVVDLGTIHSLPHRRRAGVLGLVSVHGALRVCVSLGQILGLDEEEGSEACEEGDESQGSAGSGKGEPACRSRDRRLLAIRRGAGRVVFPVTEVHGLQRIEAREQGPIPATVARMAAAFTRSLVTWRERSVGLLDEHRLFQALARSLA